MELIILVICAIAATLLIAYQWAYADHLRTVRPIYCFCNLRNLSFDGMDDGAFTCSNQTFNKSVANQACTYSVPGMVEYKPVLNLSDISSLRSGHSFPIRPYSRWAWEM